MNERFIDARNRIKRNDDGNDVSPRFLAYLLFYCYNFERHVAMS